ncbi:hypothetical protein DIPPA_18162 [Diplonema papillatum]|nr:hypothetical protein DIPPA_18162 [Diplonema papillatum]
MTSRAQWLLSGYPAKARGVVTRLLLEIGAHVVCERHPGGAKVEVRDLKAVLNHLAEAAAGRSDDGDDAPPICGLDELKSTFAAAAGLSTTAKSPASLTLEANRRLAASASDDEAALRAYVSVLRFLQTCYPDSSTVPVNWPHLHRRYLHHTRGTQSPPRRQKDEAIRHSSPSSDEPSPVAATQQRARSAAPRFVPSAVGGAAYKEPFRVGGRTRSTSNPAPRAAPSAQRKPAGAAGRAARLRGGQGARTARGAGEFYGGGSGGELDAGLLDGFGSFAGVDPPDDVPPVQTAGRCPWGREEAAGRPSRQQATNTTVDHAEHAPQTPPNDADRLRSRVEGPPTHPRPPREDTARTAPPASASPRMPPSGVDRRAPEGGGGPLPGGGRAARGKRRGGAKKPAGVGLFTPPAFQWESELKDILRRVRPSLSGSIRSDRKAWQDIRRAHPFTPPRSLTAVPGFPAAPDGPIRGGPGARASGAPERGLPSPHQSFSAGYQRSTESAQFGDGAAFFEQHAAGASLRSADSGGGAGLRYGRYPGGKHQSSGSLSSSGNACENRASARENAVHSADGANPGFSMNRPHETQQDDARRDDPRQRVSAVGDEGSECASGEEQRASTSPVANLVLAGGHEWNASALRGEHAEVPSIPGTPPSHGQRRSSGEAVHSAENTEWPKGCSRSGAQGGAETTARYPLRSDPGSGEGLQDFMASHHREAVVSTETTTGTTSERPKSRSQSDVQARAGDRGYPLRFDPGSGEWLQDFAQPDASRASHHREAVVSTVTTTSERLKSRSQSDAQAGAGDGSVRGYPQRSDPGSGAWPQDFAQPAASRTDRHREAVVSTETTTSEQRKSRSQSDAQARAGDGNARSGAETTARYPLRSDPEQVYAQPAVSTVLPRSADAVVSNPPSLGSPEPEAGDTSPPPVRVSVDLVEDAAGPSAPHAPFVVTVDVTHTTVEDEPRAAADSPDGPTAPEEAPAQDPTQNVRVRVSVASPEEPAAPSADPDAAAAPPPSITPPASNQPRHPRTSAPHRLIQCPGPSDTVFSQSTPAAPQHGAPVYETDPSVVTPRVFVGGSAGGPSMDPYYRGGSWPEGTGRRADAAPQAHPVGEHDGKPAQFQQLASIIKDVLAHLGMADAATAGRPWAGAWRGAEGPGQKEQIDHRDATPSRATTAGTGQDDGGDDLVTDMTAVGSMVGRRGDTDGSPAAVHAGGDCSGTPGVSAISDKNAGAESQQPSHYSALSLTTDEPSAVSHAPPQQDGARPLLADGEAASLRRQLRGREEEGLGRFGALSVTDTDEPSFSREGGDPRRQPGPSESQSQVMEDGDLRDPDTWARSPALAARQPRQIAPGPRTDGVEGASGLEEASGLAGGQAVFADPSPALSAGQPRQSAPGRRTDGLEGASGLEEARGLEGGQAVFADPSPAPPGATLHDRASRCSNDDGGSGRTPALPHGEPDASGAGGGGHSFALGRGRDLVSSAADPVSSLPSGSFARAQESFALTDSSSVAVHAEVEFEEGDAAALGRHCASTSRVHCESSVIERTEETLVTTEVVVEHCTDVIERTEETLVTTEVVVEHCTDVHHQDGVEQQSDTFPKLCAG